MAYSSIHMAEQYNVIDDVVAFFVAMGPMQFVIYAIAITLFGYYVNQRKKKKYLKEKL